MYAANQHTDEASLGDPDIERIAQRLRWALVVIALVALLAAEVIETRWLLGS